MSYGRTTEGEMRGVKGPDRRREEKVNGVVRPMLKFFLRAWLLMTDCALATCLGLH